MEATPGFMNVNLLCLLDMVGLPRMDKRALSERDIRLHPARRKADESHSQQSVAGTDVKDTRSRPRGMGPKGSAGGLKPAPQLDPSSPAATRSRAATD